jgi:hypothetical protein
VTSDCKPAVPGSNQEISPDCCGLLVLIWLPSGMVLRYRLSSEWQQRRRNAKTGFWFTTNQVRKPKKMSLLGHPNLLVIVLFHTIDSMEEPILTVHIYDKLKMYI